MKNKLTNQFIILGSCLFLNLTLLNSQDRVQADYSRFMNVKSWTASYTEDYRTSKTWEMRAGAVTVSSVRSSISGTYTLSVAEPDGLGYGEWYGYGKGSSTMYQVVTTTYSLSGGDISITEKTEIKSSGAIGDPSRNEYGEFWGAHLSVDDYNGTYDFGFGAPEDGMATFTRTVQGLPTDYSSLEDLPEGLRELFVPMGEKVEEWATYSGPLEDATGISPLGLAAFDMFPDMDEPEKKLPSRGLVLRGSYSGKNISKSWTIVPTGTELPKVYLEIVDKDWIPEDENTVEVKLSWENARPSEAEFTLFDISEEPGICLNSEDDNTDPDMDIVEDEQAHYFDITKNDTEIIALNKNPEEDELKLVINSLDFGAHGKIKARIKISEIWYDAEIKDLGGNELHLPYDENENHIADKWEKEVGVFDKNYDPFWDYDSSPSNQRSNGDGLTMYEEYRGFIEIGHVFKDGKNEQIKDNHVRTDPRYKDIFVNDEDGLFRAHYAPYNPADLNWHYINSSLMKHTNNVEDDENRWINYRTSGEYTNQRQYALWVRYWPVGGDAPMSAGESPQKESCKNQPYADYPGSTPLKCIYMVRVTQQGILNATRGIQDLNNKERIFAELLTTTVIHEIGHGLGINHHDNNIGTSERDRDFWSLGVKDCAMRYESSEEVQHNQLYSFLRTRYCGRGETWTRVSEDQPQGTAAQNINIDHHQSHNCYWEINIKGE